MATRRLLAQKSWAPTPQDGWGIICKVNTPHSYTMCFFDLDVVNRVFLFEWTGNLCHSQFQKTRKNYTWFQIWFFLKPVFFFFPTFRISSFTRKDPAEDGLEQSGGMGWSHGGGLRGASPRRRWSRRFLFFADFFVFFFVFPQMICVFLGAKKLRIFGRCWIFWFKMWGDFVIILVVQKAGWWLFAFWKLMFSKFGIDRWLCNRDGNFCFRFRIEITKQIEL